MISNSVQQTALQAGIKINIIPIDISELSKQTRAGEFEAALFANSINSGLDDLYQQFHSSNLAPAGDNRSHFANPHADSLISAVRTCPDETRRNVMYVEIQRILHDEVPEVFLFIPDQRTIVSKKFKYVLSSNKPAYYENMFELIK
jgi:peptide/nickel transport system substrate-binding protein